MKPISKLDECKLALWHLKYQKTINNFPKLSYKRIQEFQFRKLLKITRDAYTYVPFYRELYNRKGIDPYTFNCIADFRKIPTITKKDVLYNEDRFIDERFQKNKLIVSKTSGTSGAYMSVFCNNELFLYEELQVIRMIQELYPSYGLLTKEVLVYTSKYPVSSILGFYKAYYINNLAGSNEILRFIIEKKPSILAIYPSILLQIIDCFPNFDFAGLNIRLIIVNSEQSSQLLRDHFAKIFKCIVIDEFSSEELQSISYQCKHGSYHEVSDCTYIEILDLENDIEVNPGERGEITGTCLINKSMPLIRYRQGDYAINCFNKKCTCGKNTRIIGSPQGRINDSFITRSGCIIPSGILLDWEYSLVLSKNYPIKNYKLFQVSESKIDMFFDGINPMSDMAFDIVNDFKENISNEFDINLRPWQEHPDNYLKKPIEREIF